MTTKFAAPGWVTRVTRWRPRERAPRPPAAPYELAGSLRIARQVALALIALVVVLTTVVALSESYHSLYVYALNHEVTRGWARWFPAMVDTFVIGPELVLFVAVVDEWRWHHKAYVWLVLVSGLSVSLVGNVGHLRIATVADRCTSAVPPLAAFVGLTLGMMVLKRVLARAAGAQDVASAQEVPASVLAVLASALAESTDTKGIVAALFDAGIEDTGTLATITGVTERQVRRHKSAVRSGASAAADVPPDVPPDVPAARSRHAAGSQPRRLTPLSGLTFSGPPFSAEEGGA